MNLKQMRAANTKINPAQAAVTGDDIPLSQRAAVALGAAPSAVKGFFADIGTSYTYHENLRKQQ